MYHLRAAIVLAALIPGIAAAQADPELMPIELPRGTIHLESSEVETEFGFTPSYRFIGNGQSISLEAFYQPVIVETYGNSILVELPQGGNACPSMFTWITLDTDGLSSTREFGTCSDLPQIESTDEGILVSMPRFDGSGRSGYLFDGDILTEIELGLFSVGVDDPLNAQAWEGITAYGALTSAELEPHLLGIMDWQDLELARAASPISSNTMEQDGDWYAATGCQPHMCNVNRVGIAISTLTGTIVVALWNDAEGGRILGNPDSPLPHKLRALLRGQF